jgi:hypothetical protein
MLALLSFLKDFEYVGYFLLAVVSVRFFIQIGAAQLRLEKSLFGLEQNLLRRQRNAALGMLLLLGLTAAGIFASAHLLLPQVRQTEIQRQAGDPNKPTVVPTPTPFILFGVDVSGCANPKATILAPKPGDPVQGPVDIKLTVNPTNFAFYRIELGSPDSNDVWMTLFTSNETIQSAVGYRWDSSTMPPGVYHLRLFAVLRDGTSPRPCLVPIQVLSPPP